MSRHLHDWATRDPLACIEGLHAIDLMVQDAYALAVAVARSQGVTWEDIAAALHMSLPTAHRRYAKLVGETPTPPPQA